jgi:hypothetical protein
MIYYSLIEKQEVKQEWLTTSPTTTNPVKLFKLKNTNNKLEDIIPLNSRSRPVTDKY